MPRGILEVVVQRAYKRLCDVLCALENMALIALFAIMTVTVFAQIVLRSLFNTTILEVEDIAKYSFVWLIFIGIARVFRADGHIAITFFTSRMPPKTAAIVDYVQRCLVTIFLMVMLVEGIAFCEGGMHEIISQLRIPAGYVYFVVPLSAALSLTVYVGYLLRWLPENNED